MKDGEIMNLVNADEVLVTSVERPTSNLGFMDDGAIRRMGSKMRAKFDLDD